MFELSNSAGRDLLIKKTKSYFTTHSWNVTQTSDPRFNLGVYKSDLRFYLVCIDARIVNFLSTSEINQRLSAVSGEFKSRFGAGYAAIVNFQFPGISFDDLARTGTCALTTEELSLITDLEKLNDGRSAMLDVRERLLINSSPSLCLSIAERCSLSDDTPGAIEWMERSIAASTGISVAHRKLCRLHLEMRNIPALEKVALDALQRDPRSIEFLTIMANVARENEDPQAEARWSSVREAASETPMNFAKLIERQRGPAHMLQVTPSTDTTRLRGKQTFLGKIFARKV